MIKYGNAGLVTAQEALVLTGKKDKYQGITIDEESVQTDRTLFSTQLRNSENTWKEQGIRGVWLKLSKKNSGLIDLALNEGSFKYHHCKDDYVMLTKWMDQTSLNKMPSFATHYVGVGGLVLSKDRKRILCIQEQKPVIEGLWKLPGGLVETGEGIPEACIREVIEETGVKTKFEAIMGFKQQTTGLNGSQTDLKDNNLSSILISVIDLYSIHMNARVQYESDYVWGSQGVVYGVNFINFNPNLKILLMGFREVQGFKFGQADLYFVCLLSAIDETIDIQMPDEIAKAEWKESSELKYLRFTRVAQTVCQILLKQEELKDKSMSSIIGHIPVGDLFRTTSLTAEEYQMFNMKNTFYSSEYMKQVGEILKKSGDRQKL